uniref:Uncharacterized protein n=1 Tax=Nelumbo nucifera TaxID=4432 RepID=A0A822Z997_NELNU|nr:TPA_asm: hypothetical protein HUJ06_014348 [Nelumbo nucifera]
MDPLDCPCLGPCGPHQPIFILNG